MDKKGIYLDHAATTRAFDSVGERVRDVMCGSFGNPSSAHKMGLEAEHILREASEQIAAILKVPRETIFFTSGGTESDNLAVIGSAIAKRRAGRHIVTSKLEHPAVLSPVRRLEEEGYEVTYVKPDERGVLDPEAVASAVRDNTVLVSVMLVNNEIGSLQPLEEIARACKSKSPSVLIHTDAVQGFAKTAFYPKRADVDLMSISGHKIHGPKGVGALYIADEKLVRPILFGGGQQHDMRPGTENVPGIAGLALAAQMSFAERDRDDQSMRRCKRLLAGGALELGDVHIHGMDQALLARDTEAALDDYAQWGSAHIVSIAFRGVRAEVLLHALEDKGIYVSSGSACSTNHPHISDTLTAIGADREDLDATIRFSFDCDTSTEQIDTVLVALRELVPMLRKFTRR